MDTARVAFFKALKSFPRWMDVRKRPTKSVGGKLLQSIMDEQENIIKAYEAFKKDFFLLSYVGRENTILDHVYVYQIGNVNILDVVIEGCKAKLTEDPRKFVEDFDNYCLYQEDYIMMSEKNAPKDKMIRLTINDYVYGGKMKRLPIWNIFDEFAMFLSLERFDEESNGELMRRCFAAFKNSTNSTEEGIKNTIVNAVMNAAPVEADAIRIEAPTPENMRGMDSSGEEIYEKLVQFNHDIFRAKKWDMDTWEHGFKQLDFIPHDWDVPVKISQDGVGQMDDLKVSFSQDVKDPETTNLDITGYKADSVAINNYVLSQNIKKSIPLKLEQYKNMLKAKKVEYKITATPVTEIKTPNKIQVQSYMKVTGTSTQYLEDILLSEKGLTVNESGALKPAHDYKLIFKARTPYSDMIIDKLDFTDNGTTKSLLKETDAFKKVEGSLRGIDTSTHITSVGQLKSYSNIVNTQEGMRIQPGQLKGEFTVDVTGMCGAYFVIDHDAEAEDITYNHGLVTHSKDVVEDGNGSLVANSTTTGSTITIDVEGYNLSFDYVNSSKMGSCSVVVMVDEQLDTKNSGLWTDTKSFNEKYDSCKKIHVEITKMGLHPFEITNIKAKRYRIECNLVNKENQTDLLDLTYGKAIPYLTDPSAKNTLQVNIWNYGSMTPYIHFVHIGATMEYVTYEVNNIKTTMSPSLDIRTTCRVELYDTTGEEYTLVDDDYSTRKTYTNSSSDDIYVPIDTSKFIEILQSSRKIETALRNGKTTKCIRMRPGETLKEIKIKGVSYTLKSSENIAKLIGINKDEKIFICSNAKGFIIKDESKHKERIVKILRSKFPSMAETFSLVNAPNGMTAVFVTDEENDKSTTGASFDRNFEYFYITSNQDTAYIAYNNTTMFQSDVKGIPVVNTFSPILDTTKAMYYEISDVVQGGEKTSVLFEKGTEPPEKWRLGLQVQGANPSTVVIHTDMQYSNSDSYDLEADRLNESYTISSKISLPANVTIGGVSQELARYIITPPENIRITYKENNCKEPDIIVEEDGFNKLYYSNVVKILDIQQGGISIPQSKYYLLNGKMPDGGKEGIVVWTDDSLHGKKVDIYYTYRIPESMHYASMNDLYELVGYSTDAYRKINTRPIHIEDMHDGDKSVLDFGSEKPDKIIVQCSNQNFDAAIDGENVKVKKNVKENQALIKTGYYYDNFDEYFLYNHLHQEKIDRMNGVELFNVRINAGVFEFIRKSTNHLRDSAFSPARMDVLCDINCKINKRLQFNSDLKAITACDAYNMWSTFNMNVEMKAGYNGLGIQFASTDNPAYAIMDISHIAKPGMLLTYLQRGENFQTYIMEECLDDDDLPMVKSIYAKRYAKVERNDKNLAAYRFPEDLNTKLRHYLMVQGSGIIDDIIAKKQEPTDDIEKLHKKTLNCIRFAVSEPFMSETKLPMNFDIVGNKLDGLDITKSGLIITGSNVDWGLTKIYDIQDDIKSCKIKNGILKHGAFYAEEKDATLRTPIFFLVNNAAMKSVIVKVNDVIIDKMYGFDIKVLTSSSEYGPFKEISDQPKTNMARIIASKLSPYVQIEINIPAGRVIQSVEVYAEYIENADSPLHVYPNRNGTLISKIYDTTYRASYQLASIDGTFSDKKHTKLYMRGLRRDTGHEVWTKWYPQDLDDTLQTVTPHIFEDYQMFQFKLVLDSSRAECLIKNYVLEVV